MPLPPRHRLVWIRLLPVIALAGLLFACHKTPPPPPPAVETALPVAPSAVRFTALSDAHQLTDEQRDFLNALQPVVMRENFRIEARRHRLQSVADHYLHTNTIAEEDFDWVKDLADEYRMTPQSRSDHHFFDDLLARVDVVPPSLVLAHVALASGWPGAADSVDTVTFRHRICHQQFCVNRGLVSGLAGSADQPVLGTEQAISAYIASLNTDPAYSDFRELRAGLRAYGAEPDGLTLAASLKGLTAVGNMQVEDLELMISANHLQDKD